RITRSRLAGDPPDIHIKPKIGDIGLLEFEKADILIERGEEAAERAIPKIKEAMKVFLPPQ
ncbi:MAG: lysophospholipase, partial [Pseudomonadota bacterium]